MAGPRADLLGKGNTRLEAKEMKLMVKARGRSYHTKTAEGVVINGSVKTALHAARKYEGKGT